MFGLLTMRCCYLQPNNVAALLTLILSGNLAKRCQLHDADVLLDVKQVGRGFNNAASYLRDPYRGDDFDRGSLGGMRSDVPKHNGRTQRDTRAYDSILDDSLREDDNYGRGRTNSYTNERQEGRNNREAYRR